MGKKNYTICRISLPCSSPSSRVRQIKDAFLSHWHTKLPCHSTLDILHDALDFFPLRPRLSLDGRRNDTETLSWQKSRYWGILPVLVLVTHSCLTLCDPVDCSPPGSSVHGVLQARILERVAMPFSRGSSGPRNRIWVSYIAGRLFTVCASRKATRNSIQS